MGNLASETKLAELFFTIPNRESLNTVFTNFRSQRRHGARIESAAKKNTQWHVAHQMRRDRFFQQLAIRANVILPGVGLAIHFDVQLPIALDPRLAVLG